MELQQALQRLGGAPAPGSQPLPPHLDGLQVLQQRGALPALRLRLACRLIVSRLQLGQQLMCYHQRLLRRLAAQPQLSLHSGGAAGRGGR